MDVSSFSYDKSTFCFFFHMNRFSKVYVTEVLDEVEILILIFEWTFGSPDGGQIEKGNILNKLPVSNDILTNQLILQKSIRSSRHHDVRLSKGGKKVTKVKT